MCVSIKDGERVGVWRILDTVGVYDTLREGGRLGKVKPNPLSEGCFASGGMRVCVAQQPQMMEKE